MIALKNLNIYIFKAFEVKVSRSHSESSHIVDF
jgi:hypothetical protein